MVWNSLLFFFFLLNMIDIRKPTSEGVEWSLRSRLCRTFIIMIFNQNRWYFIFAIPALYFLMRAFLRMSVELCKSEHLTAVAARKTLNYWLFLAGHIVKNSARTSIWVFLVLITSGHLWFSWRKVTHFLWSLLFLSLTINLSSHATRHDSAPAFMQLVVSLNYHPLTILARYMFNAVWVIVWIHVQYLLL